MTRGQGHLLIVWHDSHLTGIKILDEQHRAFVSIVNSLHFMLSDREAGNTDLQPATILQPVYEMLMGYTKIHFKTEIQMLRFSDYPLVYEHKALHDRFLFDADRIYNSCLKDGEDMEQFLAFLKEFWQKHILHRDKAYSEHLVEFFLSHQRIIKKNR